ncbi:MAG: transglycosylase SLT domain-containing protein [Bdellovibrionales bacterium]
MSIHPQPIQNNMLASLEARAGAKVTSSIERASAKTGVDFAYLMQQANAESSFQADAKAKTSSATGLFQFIDRTWLSMVEQHGEKYGIDTSLSKTALLKLRNDPELSSYMAGELARDNENSLKSFLGADAEIGSTELYFAHFMGASRAAGFLKAHNESPYLKGADLFPKEAQANRGVFYNQDGTPRTLAEIYNKFDKKFSIEGADQPSTQIASKTTLQEPRINSLAPQYSNVTPFDYIQKTNPFMDLLAPSTPIIRSQDSAISGLSHFMREQYQLGNLIQDPATLLWLTQLEDSL